MVLIGSLACNSGPAPGSAEFISIRMVHSRFILGARKDPSPAQPFQRGGLKSALPNTPAQQEKETSIEVPLRGLDRL